MNYTRNKSYPFKVWLTTLFIAPILFCAATFLKEHFKFDGDYLGFVISIFIFSAILSSPVFAIYLIVYFNAKINSLKNFRLLLIAIAIAGMALSILFFFGRDSYNFHENYSGLSFTILYAVSILASSFIFSIQKK